ncbi:hypothetical protein EV424DRAFT_1455147 [Suillus variegatus]|nr:hypothetical protein EV424DRAFT_1455147 [Suillus variegatus]
MMILAQRNYWSTSHHFAQTMRFSFLTVIIALTTSIMSVGACQQDGESCTETVNCCNEESTCVLIPTGAQICYNPGDDPHRGGR